MKNVNHFRKFPKFRDLESPVLATLVGYETLLSETFWIVPIMHTWQPMVASVILTVSDVSTLILLCPFSAFTKFLWYPNVFHRIDSMPGMARFLTQKTESTCE